MISCENAVCKKIICIIRSKQFQYYYDIKPTCNPLLCLLKFTHHLKYFELQSVCSINEMFISSCPPFTHSSFFGVFILMLASFIYRIYLYCIYHFFLLWRKRHAKEITNFSTFRPKESFDRLAKRKWSHFYLKEEKSKKLPSKLGLLWQSKNN